MDNDLEEIRDEHYARWRTRRIFVIEREDDGRWHVQQHAHDGVAPMSSYVTKEEAAARLLQIMLIKEPVTPQDWPEEVCIGFVERRDDHV